MRAAELVRRPGPVEDLNDARTTLADFFSILLEIQIEELIVFDGEVQPGPVAGETRNDATMFLAKPGRFKRLTKVLPSRGCVGGETRALRWWQRVD